MAEPTRSLERLKLADQVAESFAVLEHPAEGHNLDIDKLPNVRPVFVWIRNLGSHLILIDERRVHLERRDGYLILVPVELFYLPGLRCFEEAVFDDLSRDRSVLLNEFD